MDLIRALLDQNEMSQGDLAKQIGVGVATISKIMNDKRSITPKVGDALAKRFAINPALFV